MPYVSTSSPCSVSDCCEWRPLQGRFVGQVDVRGAARHRGVDDGGDGGGRRGDGAGSRDCGVALRLGERARHCLRGGAARQSIAGDPRKGQSVQRCESPADLPFRASIAGFERTLFGMTVVRARGGGGGRIKVSWDSRENIFLFVNYLSIANRCTMGISKYVTPHILIDQNAVKFDRC